jgi:hypothetical protein
MGKITILLVSVCLLFVRFGWSNELLWEGRASYFVPADQRFKEMYGNSWMYGTEFAYQLKSNFYGWLSGDYLYKKRSHGSVTMVPLGLGLKMMTHNSFFNVYGQAGGLATYLQTKQANSPALCNPRWWIGGLLKGGVLLDIKRFILIDLFADYAFVDLPIHKSKCPERTFSNLDGWSVGIGIALSFGKVKTSKRQSTKRCEPVTPPEEASQGAESQKVVVPKRYRPIAPL